MLRYTVRRLLYAIPVFLAVLTIIFFVVRVIPGDPAVAVLGDNASKEAVQALRHDMGLDRPVVVQYATFLGDLARGDLGKSLITRKPIRDEILRVLPYSLELTAAAILVGVLLGIPVGAYAAVKRNGLADYLGRVFSLAGLSVPAFYLGLLMMLLFGVKLKILPAIGGGTFTDARDNLTHLVLPALTLGLVMTASVARLSRSALLNVLGQDYMRAARAKGLSEKVVVLRHGLRSALIPIVSLTALWAVGLIGDSVTTELVFVRPGLGKMMVGAILQRDYTAVQSVMAIYTIIVVVINFSADIIYGLVDPRITH